MDRGYAKRKLLKKDTQKAAVFGAVLSCAAAFTAALTGCVSTQAETEKIRDMKYEVIEEEDIPKLIGFLKRQEANGRYFSKAMQKEQIPETEEV